MTRRRRTYQDVESLHAARAFAHLRRGPKVTLATCRFLALQDLPPVPRMTRVETRALLFCTECCGVVASPGACFECLSSIELG